MAERYTGPCIFPQFNFLVFIIISITATQAIANMASVFLKFVLRKNHFCGAIFSFPFCDFCDGAPVIVVEGVAIV